MVILENQEGECQGYEVQLGQKEVWQSQSHLFSLMLFALMPDAGYIPVSVSI